MRDSRVGVYNKIVNGNGLINLINYSGLKDLYPNQNFIEDNVLSDCKAKFMRYLKISEEASILKCSIPLLDVFKYELSKTQESEIYININEILGITGAMLNSISNYSEIELEYLAEVLTNICAKQSRDRMSFVFKYNRDSKRLYRDLSEHIDLTIKLLMDLKMLSEGDSLRFMYFLWTEYSTVPSSLGSNALTVYLNEFEVFKRQF